MKYTHEMGLAVKRSVSDQPASGAQVSNWPWLNMKLSLCLSHLHSSTQLSEKICDYRDYLIGTGVEILAFATKTPFTNQDSSGPGLSGHCQISIPVLPYKPSRCVVVAWKSLDLDTPLKPTWTLNTYMGENSRLWHNLNFVFFSICNAFKLSFGSILKQ